MFEVRRRRTPPQRHTTIFRRGARRDASRNTRRRVCYPLGSEGGFVGFGLDAAVAFEGLTERESRAVGDQELIDRQIVRGAFLRGDENFNASERGDVGSEQLFEHPSVEG